MNGPDFDFAGLEMSIDSRPLTSRDTQRLGWAHRAHSTDTGNAVHFRGVGGKDRKVEVPHSFADIHVPTPYGSILVPSLQRHLAPDASVLDLGTGSGFYALVALDAQPTSRVTGFDILSNAGAVVERNVAREFPSLSDRVSFLQGDFLQTPLAAHDLVIANFFLWPLTGAPKSLTDAGFWNGQPLYEHLVDNASQLVAPGGTLLMTAASTQNLSALTATLQAQGFALNVDRTLRFRAVRIAGAEPDQARALEAHMNRLRDAGFARFRFEHKGNQPIALECNVLALRATRQ